MTLSPTLHRTLKLTLTWLRLNDLLRRFKCQIHPQICQKSPKSREEPRMNANRHEWEQDAPQQGSDWCTYSGRLRKLLHRHGDLGATYSRSFASIRGSDPFRMGSRQRSAARCPLYHCRRQRW
jgi:hypothetical protein